MGNPLIQHGMVVHVCKDPRDGSYIAYRYDNKRDDDARCICFQDSIETFTKLGFETGAHWNPPSAEKGYMSVKQLSIHFYVRESELPAVDPVATRLMNEKPNNQTFAHLLSREA